MMDLGSVKAEKASGVQGRPSGCLEEGSNWNLHTLAVQMFLYEITSWKCLKNGLAAVGIKTLSQALPHILPFEICSLFPAFTEMLKQHRAASMFLYSIQHYNSYYRQCLNILLILKAKFAQLCRILPCITPTQSLQLYPHQAPHALPPSSPEPQITTQGSTGTSRQLLCSPPISCRRAAHSHPCPHHSSFPLFSKIFPLHLLATLFPGGALLDWLGFNCSAQPGSEWNFTFASSSCSLELPQFLWISEKYPLVIHRICPFVPHGVRTVWARWFAFIHIASSLQSSKGRCYSPVAPHCERSLLLWWLDPSLPPHFTMGTCPAALVSPLTHPYTQFWLSRRASANVATFHLSTPHFCFSLCAAPLTKRVLYILVLKCHLSHVYNKEKCTATWISGTGLSGKQLRWMRITFIITSSDASLSNTCHRMPYPSLSIIPQAPPNNAELEAEAQPRAARCSCWNVAQLLRSASLLPSYNQ